MPFSQTAAFSTFEFLVAVLLALLISTQGIPALKELKQSYFIRNAAYQIESVIELQANRSLLMEKTIHIKASAKTLYLCTKNQGSEELCLTSLYELPKETSITSASFRQPASRTNILTLYSDGSASPGTIRIEGENKKTCDIVQSLRGRTKVEC